MDVISAHECILIAEGEIVWMKGGLPVETEARHISFYPNILVGASLRKYL
jgi:hypothetical protein